MRWSTMFFVVLCVMVTGIGVQLWLAPNKIFKATAWVPLSQRYRYGVVLIEKSALLASSGHGLVEKQTYCNFATVLRLCFPFLTSFLTDPLRSTVCCWKMNVSKQYNTYTISAYRLQIQYGRHVTCCTLATKLCIQVCIACHYFQRLPSSTWLVSCIWIYSPQMGRWGEGCVVCVGGRAVCGGSV